MKRGCFFLLLLIFLGHLYGRYDIKKVDFLSEYGLKVNGAGPLLIEVDEKRDMIVLANTNTSSVSFIAGWDNAVFNISLKNRVPQFLKQEALIINSTSGDVYLIGNKCLHLIFPDKRRSISINTEKQFEMVTVDEVTGDAFLAGRESKFLAVMRMYSKKMRKFNWLKREEKIKNLNATPPPPIRKVVADPILRRIAAIDGYDSTLYIFSLSGKVLKKRKLKVTGGGRWHFAGYNYKSHHMYLVIETEKRKVIEAIKVDIKGNNDVIVPLPGYSEGVGITYHARRDEIYIPYDNHPLVQVVSFKSDLPVREIKIPAYGNDAAALNLTDDLLYIASWAYGEIDIIDLAKGKLTKRLEGLGILPHMFTMAFNPNNKKIYFPLGATAVNGSFGAAVTCLDPVTEKKNKIYTGWAPIDLVQLKNKEFFLVFNSEDEFAMVYPKGDYETYKLPVNFPHQVINSPGENVYLSYGPHQSFWPTVYIWGAKNGILGINSESLDFYDRRIPRLAHKIVCDRRGSLYALQNNWGEEKQFMISLPDEIRAPNLPDMRLELSDSLLRETTQRILKYDSERDWLYLVRVGEQDFDSGIFQIIEADTSRELFKGVTGLTPTDLIFDNGHIYICNFDSDSISIINKDNFKIKQVKTGKKPFKICRLTDKLYVINHNDSTLQLINEQNNVWSLPFSGKPDNLFSYGKELILTLHTDSYFRVVAFSPQSGSFELILEEQYPFGEISLDTNNSSFFIRGQLADAIYELNQIKKDREGRLWISDYLSGKLFVVSKN